MTMWQINMYLGMKMPGETIKFTSMAQAKAYREAKRAGLA